MRHKSGPDYIVDPGTDCWIWQKNVRMGYGRKWDGEKLVSAHVWYWEQKNGSKPEGMDLDHLCHTRDKACSGGTSCAHRRCVNPEHLELVTRAINIYRGRNSKLTQAQVDEIRAHPGGWGYRKALAEKHGISTTAITKLRAGAYWTERRD